MSDGFSSDIRPTRREMSEMDIFDYGPKIMDIFEKNGPFGFPRYSRNPTCPVCRRPEYPTSGPTTDFESVAGPTNNQVSQSKKSQSQSKSEKSQLKSEKSQSKSKISQSKSEKNNYLILRTFQTLSYLSYLISRYSQTFSYLKIFSNIISS